MPGIKYPDKPENKYYTKVENKRGKQGYSYGQYKPGMIKDNGEPLKKNGRPKGSTSKTPIDFGIEMQQIVSWTTFGKKNIENSKNIKEGVKKDTPLSIIQACREMGMSYNSFNYYINKFPEVRKQYEIAKESRTKYMQEIADELILKGMRGKLKKVTDKERVDWAFRFQEKTNQRYNPKQVIEQTVEEVNPNRTSDDILGDIMDLIPE